MTICPSSDVSIAGVGSSVRGRTGESNARYDCGDGTISGLAGPVPEGAAVVGSVTTLEVTVAGSVDDAGSARPEQAAKRKISPASSAGEGPVAIDLSIVKERYLIPPLSVGGSLNRERFGRWAPPTPERPALSSSRTTTVQISRDLAVRGGQGDAATMFATWLLDLNTVIATYCQVSDQPAISSLEKASHDQSNRRVDPWYLAVTRAWGSFRRLTTEKRLPGPRTTLAAKRIGRLGNGGRPEPRMVGGSVVSVPSRHGVRGQGDPLLFPVGHRRLRL